MKPVTPIQEILFFQWFLLFSNSADSVRGSQRSRKSVPEQVRTVYGVQELQLNAIGLQLKVAPAFFRGNKPTLPSGWVLEVV